MLNSAFVAVHVKSVLSALTGQAIMLFARLVTAVRGNWVGIEPIPKQRVYFANHVSHGDFVLIWTTLPARLRLRTRPVAGADYWLSSALKSFIGKSVFRAVLIERTSNASNTSSASSASNASNASNASDTSIPTDAIGIMNEALIQGDSLILFPEGTRNTTDERLLPFKKGLYHLARANPSVELVPVWIDNLHRVLPKGEFIPVPLACTVTYGEAITLNSDESKEAFIQRAQYALLQTGSNSMTKSS